MLVGNKHFIIGHMFVNMYFLHKTIHQITS